MYIFGYIVRPKFSFYLGDASAEPLNSISECISDHKSPLMKIMNEVISILMS